MREDLIIKKNREEAKNMNLNQVKLSAPQQGKWFRNLLVFIAPVIVMYLTTIVGVISTDGHVFSLKDFIPTTFAQGGIVLWFLNTALDYLRKLKG